MYNLEASGRSHYKKLQEKGKKMSKKTAGVGDDAYGGLSAEGVMYTVRV